MTDPSPPDDRTVERAVRAALADLHRQAETTGCATEDNGQWVQVDGSFEIEPLVRAVLEAAGSQS